MATAIEEAKSGSVLLFNDYTQITKGKPQVVVEFYNPSRTEIAGPFESLVSCGEESSCVVIDSDEVEVDSVLAPGNTTSRVTDQGVWVKTTILPGGAIKLVADLASPDTPTRLIVDQKPGERPPRLFIRSNTAQGFIIKHWFDIILSAAVIIGLLLIVFLAFRKSGQIEGEPTGNVKADISVDLSPILKAVASDRIAIAERLNKIESILTSSNETD